MCKRTAINRLIFSCKTIQKMNKQCALSEIESRKNVRALKQEGANLDLLPSRQPLQDLLLQLTMAVIQHVNQGPSNMLDSAFNKKKERDALRVAASLDDRPLATDKDKQHIVHLSAFFNTLDRRSFTHLQKCLLNACVFSLDNQSDNDRTKGVLLELLNSWVLSKRGMYESASSTECGYKRFSSQCIRAACATLQASGLLVHGMLRHLTVNNKDRLQGILCIRKFRYDETPMKSRVRAWNESMQKVDTDVSDHAKLMQVEFTIWCLFKDLVTDNFVLLESKIPSLLHAVERTTAVCTKKCLTDCMDTIPDFLPLVETKGAFNWLLHNTCTDRYNANVAAEKSLALESPQWSKSNFFCDVHRVSQAQIQTSDLFPEDTSGMLAVALFQRDMGALHRLREMLADILVNDIEIVYGCPPDPPQSRADLYDVLLPIPSRLSRGRKDSKTIVRMLQRFILSSIFNGDIQSNSIVHYCEFNCCRSWEHTMTKVRQFVVWALLPHKCPKFVKSRWTGHESTIAWNAILMSHHNLHERLIVRYTGVPERPIVSATRAPIMVMEAVEDATECDWSFLLDSDQNVTSDTPMHALLDATMQDPLEALQLADRPVQEELLEEFSAAVKTAEEAFDASVAQKRAFKKKAGLWSQSRPLPRLLILMDVIMVIRSLLHRMFYIASEKFEKAQRFSASRGHSRTYRVLEAALGKYVSSFFHALCELLQRGTAGFRETDMSPRYRSWAFRTISRCGCAMHQLLRSRHRQNPYLLFKILIGHIDEIISVPSCLRDELASKFFKRFPTRSAATSPEAMAVLQGIALASDTDISAMESRHAITRRFTTLRSLQTWTASLEDVNVQWIMKQAAATSAKPKFKRMETESQTQERKRHGRGKHRHGPGGKGGGGGAWRAFLHVRHAGEKMCKDSLKKASSEHLRFAFKIQKWHFVAFSLCTLH